MHPAAADHRRDDLHLAQLLRLARRTGRGRARRGRRDSPESACRGGGRRARARRERRRSRETPARPSAPPPAARPGRSSIERSTPATTPGERVELLDRRVRAVHEDARPSRAASGTSTCPRAGRARDAPRGRGPTARARTARSRRSRARRSGGDPPGVRHCACSIRCRRPLCSQTSRVASNASSAFRFAWSPIACTPTGQPRSAPRRMISSSSSRRGDLDAASRRSAARSASRAFRP